MSSPSCPCTFCGGAAHPATGCVYTSRVIACWRCTDEFWAWMKGHFATRSRPGRQKGGRLAGRLHADFYAAAVRNHPTGRGIL